MQTQGFGNETAALPPLVSPGVTSQAAAVAAQAPPVAAQSVAPLDSPHVAHAMQNLL